MNRNVPFLYYFGKYLLTPLFKFWYRPKIINKEYIPKTGPFIIAGNHKHVYDQYLTIIATSRGIHYLAKKEYYDNLLTRWYYRGVGCIFVDRSKKDPHVTEAAINVLKDGGAIGIFPEGTRNKTTAKLLPFKFGAVSMAQKAGVPIIPFGLTGDYKFRSHNLTIRYGKPFSVNDMSLEEANKKLEKEVLKLMEENEK